MTAHEKNNALTGLVADHIPKACGDLIPNKHDGYRGEGRGVCSPKEPLTDRPVFYKLEII